MKTEEQLYAGGYRAFKKCLIDSWPNGRVEFCAHMVMIDVGFPIHLINNLWCFFNDTSAFVQHLKMPQMRPTNGVATYLANHYPKTSTALFDGKSKEACLQVFMAEKGSKGFPTKTEGSARTAKQILRKEEAYVTIRMRSLSKNHDWKTVK
jgi:hypothetical protein